MVMHLMKMFDIEPIINLHSESSISSSIFSQPSLPTVPSLSSPSLHEETSITHQKCIATLKGHSCVVSIALAGKVLYSGFSNGEIRAWRQYYSEQDNPIENIVATTNSAVKSLVVLRDKLFSAHQDNKIRIWKIDYNHLQRKYKCITTLPTMSDRFLRCFSEKNYVQVRRHKKSTWVHHVDTVSALAISIDCSLLYSASWDRTFKVWRTSDFKCLESVRNAHDDAINGIILSKDGFVYTCSADKTIKVWKKKRAAENKHSLVVTLEKHKSAVNALALSNDGTVFYSGAGDRSILVWERENSVGGGGDDRHMVLVGALRGQNKAILCLAVVANLVCSGSADKTVRIWRRAADKSYSCLTVLEGHNRPLKCLTAAVDGNTHIDGASEACTTYTVCSGSLDCDIKVWQVRASAF